MLQYISVWNILIFRAFDKELSQIFYFANFQIFQIRYIINDCVLNKNSIRFQKLSFDPKALYSSVEGLLVVYLKLERAITESKMIIL